MTIACRELKVKVMGLANAVGPTSVHLEIVAIRCMLHNATHVLIMTPCTHVTTHLLTVTELIIVINSTEI